MKFFLDTANLEEIRKANEWGILDGVTTNPTLVSKEKENFEDLIREILRIVRGPVSVEVTSSDSSEMIEHGRRFARMASNVVVKVPITIEGLKAMKVLIREGIKINVTLIFSANQGLIAAKAGATYASPFIGRLDDIGHDGMQVVRDMLQIYKNYNFKTQVLVGSIRHPLHVLEAAKAGAHIATMPFAIMEKLFKHALTDAGEKIFLEDWMKKKLKFS